MVGALALATGLYYGGQAIAPTINAAGSAYQSYLSSIEAEKNRDWQERMSNTAHTREVADLRRAGLNPILSATGGQGASTPSGSMAQVADFGHIGDTVNASKDIAQKGLNTKADVKLKSIQEAKTASEVHNLDQDTSNKIIQGGLMNEQIAQTQQDTALKGIQTQLAQKDLNWYDKKTLIDMQTKIISANAQKASAQANITSAKAGMINAQTNQTSSPWRTGVDVTRQYINKIPKSVRKYLPNL